MPEMASTAPHTRSLLEAVCSLLSRVAYSMPVLLPYLRMPPAAMAAGSDRARARGGKGALRKSE
ncbi:MAG: hypothetical protein BWY75_03099 [bacterium ADurb.Bin425]|nr:MAG: hypothetical protein BWY75_03099 [bacterium ADurb.Bin425]